jgi:hypothetical protein
MQTFMKWKELAADETLRPLATIAMRNFSRPASASVCERLFSNLEDMNSTDRANMKKEALALNLYLKGNASVLDDLLHELDAEQRAAAVSRTVEAQGRAEAEAHGIRPTRATWHHLADAALRCRRPESAVDAVEAMTRAGHQPDAATWTKVVAAQALGAPGCSAAANSCSSGVVSEDARW